MPTSSLRNWADLLVSFGRAESPAVLDLGTGTGMFAVALTRCRRGSQVVAIDPSPAMLAQAATLASHPRVRYLAGNATALPIGDRTIDLALLSRIIHQVSDRRGCAARGCPASSPRCLGRSHPHHACARRQGSPPWRSGRAGRHRLLFTPLARQLARMPHLARFEQLIALSMGDFLLTEAPNAFRGAAGTA
jgi:SAM-dependent methyltransferase